MAQYLITRISYFYNKFFHNTMPAMLKITYNKITQMKIELGIFTSSHYSVHETYTRKSLCKKACQTCKFPLQSTCTSYLTMCQGHNTELRSLAFHTFGILDSSGSLKSKLPGQVSQQRTIGSRTS